MTQAEAHIAGLQDRLRRLQRVAIAVSGGIDSLSLATLAHRTTGVHSQVFHAVSPAVPPQATARVRELARQEGWALTVIDAGEFDDPRYRDNPVDRCYYCKHGLYRAIAAQTDDTILSGANRDDLADYRPGLQAAAEHGVRHPFVEAGFGKAAIRQLARELGLGKLAELPASPCLSSRVETGIPIDGEQLRNINAAELLVARALSPRTVRCRIRPRAVEIQLDAETLDDLAPRQEAALGEAIARLFGHPADAIRFRPYAMGSAFLREGMQ